MQRPESQRRHLTRALDIGHSECLHHVAESPKLLTDAKTGLGMPLSVFGAFFFVQSYGYALGAGREPPSSVAEAVTYGLIHLSHLVTPWSNVAWPLTPSLCGFLLLYSAVLPTQLAAAGQDDNAASMNRRYYAGLASVIIIAMLAGASKHVPSSIELIAHIRMSPFGIGQPIVYAAGVILLFWISNELLARLLTRKPAWRSPSPPWPNIISVATIAVLYMVAFVGSEFDGRLDQLTGNVAW